jgi:hypothetical protein
MATGHPRVPNFAGSRAAPQPRRRRSRRATAQRTPAQRKAAGSHGEAREGRESGGTSTVLLPATHARGTSRTQPRNHWSTYVFARASSRGAPSAASLCIFVSDSSWLSASVCIQKWRTTTTKKTRYGGKRRLRSRFAARGGPENALQRRAPRRRVNRLVHSRPAAQVHVGHCGGAGLRLEARCGALFTPTDGGRIWCAGDSTNARALLSWRGR